MAVKKTLSEMEQGFPDSAARGLIAALFDDGSFVEIDRFHGGTSVITGYGLVGGATVYAFAEDSEVKSGAVTMLAASRLEKLYAMAKKNGAPIVGIYDSKGGSIEEGAGLLAAYARIAAASTALSGVVPQVAVVAGVCAGMSAALCGMADFVIMSEKAELFMTPPFLSEDKTAGAGSANHAVKSGIASLTAPTAEDAVKLAAKLLTLLPANNLEPGGNPDYEQGDSVVTAMQKGPELISAVADKNSVIELGAGFGEAAFTGLGSLNWFTVGFVATNKTDSRLCSDDCVKIARFVSFCNAFSIPVVTIVDSEGVKNSSADETRGAIRDVAKLIQVYAGASTPKISLVTGNATGAVFAAMAISGTGSDVSLAFDTAVISPVPVKAAAVFLKNDMLAEKSPEQLAAAYTAEEASVWRAAAEGYIDRVIEPSETREILISALDLTSGKRVDSPNRKQINFVF